MRRRLYLDLIGGGRKDGIKERRQKITRKKGTPPPPSGDSRVDDATERWF
jgi:hypothetical protein